MGNLKRLDLSGNHYTGQYPEVAFSTLTNIQWMSLARTNFLEPLGSNPFQNKTLLENLDLSGNQFKGSLPNFTKTQSCKACKYLITYDDVSFLIHNLMILNLFITKLLV